MEHHQKDSNLKPTFKAQIQHTNGILGLKEKLRTNSRKEKACSKGRKKNLILFWSDIWMVKNENTKYNLTTTISTCYFTRLMMMAKYRIILLSFIRSSNEKNKNKNKKKIFKRTNDNCSSAFRMTLKLIWCNEKMIVVMPRKTILLKYISFISPIYFQGLNVPISEYKTFFKKLKKFWLSKFHAIKIL